MDEPPFLKNGLLVPVNNRCYYGLRSGILSSPDLLMTGRWLPVCRIYPSVTSLKLATSAKIKVARASII